MTMVHHIRVNFSSFLAKNSNPKICLKMPDRILVISKNISGGALVAAISSTFFINKTKF